MDLINLQIQNFGSYKQASIGLSELGLVLIEGHNSDAGGSNGSGKSMILEALCWGLFGVTNRGIKGSDIVLKGHKNALVVVELSHNGANIRIMRYREHSQFANKLLLFYDNKEITAVSDKETQLKINSLLNFNWEIFRNIVTFPQNGAGFATLGDAEQKEILERVLGFNRFSTAQIRAKEIHDQLDKSLERSKQEVKVLEARVAEIEASLANLARADDAYYEDKQKKISNLDYERNALTSNPPTFSQEVVLHMESLQTQLNGSKRLEYGDLLEKTRFNIISMEQKVAELTAKSSTLRYYSQTKPPEEYQVDPSAPCPACGQALPKPAIEHLLREKAAQKDKDAEVVLNYLIEADQVDGEADLISKKIDKAKTLQDKILVELEKSDSLQKEIDSLELTISQQAREKHDWELSVKSLEDTLNRLMDSDSPYVTIISITKDKLQVTKDQLKVCAEAVQPLYEELSYVDYWIKGFGNQGVKSFLLDQVTPFLNQRANEYLFDLTDGQAEVKFETQITLANGEKRDKFSVEVGYKHGSGNYKGISGGERRRADISILFALGDLASSRSATPIRFRFLDEPFGDLDSGGEEAVVTLLRKRILPKLGTIMVVTHSDSLKSLFEKRILVEKTNGVSKILEDV